MTQRSVRNRLDWMAAAAALVLLAACEDKSRARHVEPKTVTSIVYGIDSTDDQTIRAAVNVLRQRLDNRIANTL